MLNACASAFAQLSLFHGFTIRAPSRSVAAPVNFDNTRLPGGMASREETIALLLWQATYSQHTRFMPSRVLETKQTSAAAYKAVSSSGLMDV